MRIEPKWFNLFEWRDTKSSIIPTAGSYFGLTHWAWESNILQPWEFMHWPVQHKLANFFIFQTRKGNKLRLIFQNIRNLNTNIPKHKASLLKWIKKLGKRSHWREPIKWKCSKSKLWSIHISPTDVFVHVKAAL